MTGHWKLSRVVGAMQPGVGLDVCGSSGPELCLPGGRRQPLTPSLGKHRVVFKCVGCAPGHQHYRVATCKSVGQPSDLWCLVCMYTEELWRRARKRVLPDCELWFIAVLVCLGIDTQFAFQAHAPFWHKPLDAHNLHQGYFVQIDGRCHWVGMRGVSRGEVLERDMEQNMAAMEAGARLVRMHARDLGSEGVVQAALLAAARGYSIVLTPSYAAELYTLHGLRVPYVRALWLVVPNCWYVNDGYGNYCFWLV